MYGKIFESCFSGSMVGAGPTVFALWSYVISHAFESLVEINPRLVAAIIGTTPEDIEKAIKYLCDPDPESRNKAHDGSRLVHQHAFIYLMPSWETYTKIRNAEEHKIYMRGYMRDYREEAGKNKLKHVLTKVNSKQMLTMLGSSASASASDNNEEGKIASKFNKPNESELKEYASSIGFDSFDPSRFLDHYESNGWRVGKNPMKNWQAAVRTWKKTSFHIGGGSKPPFKFSKTTPEQAANYQPPTTDDPTL